MSIVILLRMTFVWFGDFIELTLPSRNFARGKTDTTLQHNTTEIASNEIQLRQQPNPARKPNTRKQIPLQHNHNQRIYSSSSN